MAPRTKAAAKEVAPPEFAHYVEKEPTALQQSFTEWIEEKTGYEPDPKSVQLAVALRMTFQRSEENQADLEARREAALAKAEARETRAAERAASKEEVAEEKPKKAAGRKPAAAASAAPATRVAAPPRRRAAAPAA